MHVVLVGSLSLWIMDWDGSVLGWVTGERVLTKVVYQDAIALNISAARTCCAPNWFAVGSHIAQICVFPLVMLRVEVLAFLIFGRLTICRWSRCYHDLGIIR